jgi:hypothetical protein
MILLVSGSKSWEGKKPGNSLVPKNHRILKPICKHFIEFIPFYIYCDNKSNSEKLKPG